VPTATVPAFGPLVSPWIYRVRLGDPEEKADAPYADILTAMVGASAAMTAPAFLSP